MGHAEGHGNAHPQMGHVKGHGNAHPQMGEVPGHLFTLAGSSSKFDPLPQLGSRAEQTPRLL